MNHTTFTITQPVSQGVGAIHAPSLSDDDARQLCADIADNYLVEVDATAPSCCIDGRSCITCKSGKPSGPRAKVAGGSLITAYAAAELTGWFAPNDSTNTTERLRLIADTLEVGGIICGGHCDTAANAQKFAAGTTGCGACDKLPIILQNVAVAQELVTGSVQLLFDDAYDEQTMQSILETAKTHPINDWHATDMIDVLGAKSDDRIEVLASDDSPTHGHAESMVVINTHEGMTVNRDHLLADGKPQVFAADAWYIDKLAHALARGPEAQLQYVALKHAMVSYQVATLYTLGDGSHRIGVI